MINAKDTKPEITTPGGQSGFTLTELFVITIVLAVLALMLLPALGESKTRSRGLRCLDNMRQVINATLMYTHDYHDLFPPNPDDGTTQPGYNWAAGNVSGGMPDDPPPASSHVFDSDILSDPHVSLLARYLGDSSVYRCTGDPRQGLYDGNNSSRFGTIVPAARSIAMSGAVGTEDPSWLSGGGHSGIPNVPTSGPWLTGSHGVNQHNNPWRTYGSLTDMVIPVPASTMVLIEEEPYSINDAHFAFSASVARWVDVPSTRHNMACALSFGDGHVELHKWQNMAGIRITSRNAFPGPIPATDPDWNWLKARTSVRAP